ncbi:MAG: transposase [Thermodesulfobacteriota bacterium]
MPRQARLDIPGLLQHVIVRGIEGRNIFRDSVDRQYFVDRFSNLLQETDTGCFAWAIIPNHFHLLLLPRRIELKQFMRRLLTGYAVTYNKRHDRSGHVFQNRYKSIVCEEEIYLLELVRYIHLNPLRANVVPDLASLNRYKWCGHSVLMGGQTLEGQVVDEVLARFGRTPEKARSKYLEFITDGLEQGRRPEFAGTAPKKDFAGAMPNAPEFESYDERVLGSGAFTEQLRQEQGLRGRLAAGMKLPELMGRVEDYYGLEAGRLGERSRDKQVVKARDVFCHIAVRTLLYSAREAGSLVSIKRSAASHAVRRRGEILAGQPDAVEKILS